MDKNEKIKLRIILSGGYVKSSFQLGVLSEIIKSGRYAIDSVYGCSSGSMLSPFVANEKMDLLIEKFLNIKNLDDIFERYKFLGIQLPNWNFINLFNVLFKLGAYKSIKLIEDLQTSLTPEEIKIAQQKCHVVAYDIINNEERWFTGDELIDGIRCSTALWLAVQPIQYKGNMYSDGGVTEVFPIDYIIQHEIHTKFDGQYLFIDCDSRKPYKNTIPTNALGFMVDLHWAASSRLAEFELEKLKNRLHDRLSIIRPDETLINGIVDPVKMKAYFEAGIIKGKEFLEK